MSVVDVFFQKDSPGTLVRHNFSCGRVRRAGVVLFEFSSNYTKLVTLPTKDLHKEEQNELNKNCLQWG